MPARVPFRRRAAALVVLGAVALPGPTLAQRMMPERVQSAVDGARDLEKRGQVIEAGDTLHAQLQQACTDPATRAACRFELGVASGDLLARWASVAKADQQTQLAKAAASYEAALRERPDHVPTILALAQVQRRRKNPAAAETLLAQALTRSPEDERLAVALGDTRRADGRTDQAVAAYRQAADFNPLAELPRRRLLDVYLRGMPATRSPLLGVLADLERPFASLAEQGYRQIIERTYRSEPGVAEQSLVRWTSVLARARRLTPASADALPKDWSDRPASELRAYLGRVDRRPPRPWSPSDPHNQALAEAALALGHERLLGGDPPGTALRWEIGLEFAPAFNLYRPGAPLQKSPAVFLDLEAELATLYLQYPALDPRGDKFRRVVDRIFNTKGEAYKAEDLAAIQRHHMVLGRIYAERGTWQGGWAQNAEFQLENALKTAAERDRRDGTYQPLPAYRALFARALEKKGGQGTRARETYLSAAQAYLDTDELKSADDALAQADRQPGAAAPTTAQWRKALARVLDTRKVLANAGADEVDPASATSAFGAGSAQGHGWVAGDPLPGLVESFLARQRFKARADLAARADELGRPRAAIALSLAALEVAVDKVAQLGGIEDFVRLERIRTRLTKDRVTGQRALALDVGPPQKAPTARTWTLAVDVESTPARVVLAPDDLLAARVTAALAADPALAGREVTFRVRRAEVVLPAGEAQPDVRRIAQRVPGVARVTDSAEW